MTDISVKVSAVELVGNPVGLGVAVDVTVTVGVGDGVGVKVGITITGVGVGVGAGVGVADAFAVDEAEPAAPAGGLTSGLNGLRPGGPVYAAGTAPTAPLAAAAESIGDAGALLGWPGTTGAAVPPDLPPDKNRKYTTTASNTTPATTASNTAR